MSGLGSVPSSVHLVLLRDYTLSKRPRVRHRLVGTVHLLFNPYRLRKVWEPECAAQTHRSPGPVVSDPLPQNHLVEPHLIHPRVSDRKLTFGQRLSLGPVGRLLSSFRSQPKTEDLVPTVNPHTSRLGISLPSPTSPHRRGCTLTKGGYCGPASS